MTNLTSVKAKFKDGRVIDIYIEEKNGFFRWIVEGIGRSEFYHRTCIAAVADVLLRTVGV